MVPRLRFDRQIGSAEPVVGDVRVAELAGILALFGAWDGPEVDTSAEDVTDAQRIERIALMERIKAAVAGAQTAEVVRFARSQVAEQEALGVHPRVVGRGVGDQVGLACKVSPSAGSQRVSMARALWFDLPCTYAHLRAGEISEYVASLVCRETSHLDVNTRRHVDAELAGQGVGSMAPRRAAAAARGLAFRADPAAAVRRAKIEETQRRVTVRPAPDTMAILTAYLPAVHGIAAWAALGQHADTCLAGGDPRTRNQIMADSLVERVTGQAVAGDVDVEIGLIMPFETMTDETSHRPADLNGYGPIPAPIARDLIRTTQGKIFLRRLFTAPTGQIVGGDHRRRRLSSTIAKIVTARDRHCRDPFCDAPIRHNDHIHRYTDGGPTTPTNSRGVCARGNYVREMPGWTVHILDDGLDSQPHTIQITTPTGHIYTNQAPQPP